MFNPEHHFLSFSQIDHIQKLKCLIKVTELWHCQCKDISSISFSQGCACRDSSPQKRKNLSAFTHPHVVPNLYVSDTK